MLLKIKNILSIVNIGLCLILLSILNIIDGFFTIFWLDYGLAEEANPIMKKALEFGDTEFLLIKFVIVSLSCLILYAYRKLFLSKLMVLTGLACYIFLAIYHLLAYIHFSSVL